MRTVGGEKEFSDFFFLSGNYFTLPPASGFQHLLLSCSSKKEGKKVVLRDFVTDGSL